MIFIISIAYYLVLDQNSLTIIIFSILLNYLASVSFKKSGAALTKVLLIIILLFDVYILFWFKYYAMFGVLLVDIFKHFGYALNIDPIIATAPIGLSFIVFKMMSYIIDVYNEDIPPEKNFFVYTAYVLLFLQCLAGPIDRASKLIPQIRDSSRAFDFQLIFKAFLFILCGLSLKVVVADRLALYTNLIFDNITHYKGLSLILAAYLYTFQIYADFAGYTLMAIGFGYSLGYEFSKNFDLPYFSQSISEFWRRWHITLSYWFRDYLYIPLGGNRKGAARQYFNFLIVFLLCGLWHGANWTFVLWGGIHGCYLIIGSITKGAWRRVLDSLLISPPLQKAIHILFTFHLIMFAWVFFRANSIGDALFFFQHCFVEWPSLEMDANAISYGVIAVLVLMVIEFFQYRNMLSIDIFMKKPLVIKLICVYFLIFSIILAGVDSSSSFIYVQF